MRLPRLEHSSRSRQALADALQVTRRPDFRRAGVGALIFIASASTAAALGGLHSPMFTHRITTLALTFTAAIAGGLGTRSAASELGRLVLARAGARASGVLRLLASLLGYLIVAATVAAMLTLPVSRLLLSGAITGVIVGIAAQQSLGNAFAGLVLLFARPFTLGDYITLRSGALGGQYDGSVVSIGLMYTVLETADGPITLPNSGVLASATGPRRYPPQVSGDATAALTIDPDEQNGDRAAPRRAGHGSPPRSAPPG